MIRVKNGMPYIRYTLRQFSRVKQMSKIIVFNDNSTDGTVNECKKYSKVKIINSPYKDHNEVRDRNFILREAKKFDPEWICSLDHDEIFEEPNIYEIIDSLLNPQDPQTLCYIFPLLHHWDSENQWRADGLWGNFLQERMFKNLEGQEIEPISTDNTNLSGCVPWFSLFNTHMPLCRIRHFGNLDRNVREKKYDFYANLYREKGVSPLALGSWEEYYKKLYNKEKLDPEDYALHIKDERGIILHKWADRVSISLNIVTKNNESQIGPLLSLFRKIVDEIVVVDTGSTDNTIEICKSYGANIIKTEWKHDFSYVRNLCIQNSTKEWIIRLDADELVEPDDLLKLWYMACAGEVDAYIFPVRNFLEDPRTTKNAKWFHSQSIRMFRRHSGVKYTGLVHEEIDKSLRDLNLGRQINVAFSSVPFLHFGYLNPKEYLEKKFDYYYKLCLKQIELEPNNFYPYHSVAVHMKHIGRYDEAKKFFHESLKREPKAFLSYAGLAEIAEIENDFDSAIELYTKAYTIDNPLRTQDLTDGFRKKAYELKIKKEIDRMKSEFEKEIQQGK